MFPAKEDQKREFTCYSGGGLSERRGRTFSFYTYPCSKPWFLWRNMPTAVFIKPDQCHFTYLPSPGLRPRGQNLLQEVLAWVTFLLSSCASIFLQFIIVGLDPQTVSDGLPISKIQHSIFNNLYATDLYSLSQ